jgi:hypothetical protein
MRCSTLVLILFANVQVFGFTAALDEITKFSEISSSGNLTNILLPKGACNKDQECLDKSCCSKGYVIATFVFQILTI